MGLRSRRVRYADVASTLALVVALSGGAYAAATLPKGSVDSPQLRPRAVTAPKLSDDAVASRAVLDGSLRSRDFAAGQLLRWRGQWSPAFIYEVGDAVQYQGSSYRARSATSQTPQPGSDWAVLAAGGARGPQGAMGPMGPSSGSWAAGDTEALNCSSSTVVETSITPQHDAQVFATASGTWSTERQGVVLWTNIELSKGTDEVIAGTLPTTQPADAANQDEPLAHSGILAPVTGATPSNYYRLTAGTTYTLRLMAHPIASSCESAQIKVGPAQLSYILVGAPPSGW